MKNFNKKIYGLNMASIKLLDHEIPKEYWKMTTAIAGRFSKEYSSIGVMNINDLYQEGYYALLKSWSTINWERLYNIEDELERKKALVSYLSKSIKLRLRNQIKDVLSGTLPRNGIWNKKDNTWEHQGYKFLTILFPQWFDSQILTIVDEEVYDYGYLILGEYLDGWLLKHIPKYHQLIRMAYGLDDIYSKPKSQKEIAAYFNTTVSNIQNIKHRMIKKLRASEIAKNELAWFVVTNDIKSQSMVYNYANNNLKIF